MIRVNPFKSTMPPQKGERRVIKVNMGKTQKPLCERSVAPPPKGSGSTDRLRFPPNPLNDNNGVLGFNICGLAF